MAHCGGMKRKGRSRLDPRIGRHAGRTPEQVFLDNLNVAGRVVFDGGAFEGLITSFFSCQARRVVCCEASSRNYKTTRGCAKTWNLTA
jgi:hypothetical protein